MQITLTWQVIGIAILSTLGVVFLIRDGVPFLLKKVGPQNIATVLTAAAQVSTLIEQLSPDGSIPDTIARYAYTAVRAAEKLFKPGENDDKLRMAKEYIYTTLRATTKLMNLTEDDKAKLDEFLSSSELSVIIDGAIEAAVIALPPTKYTENLRGAMQPSLEPPIGGGGTVKVEAAVAVDVDTIDP